MLRRYRVAHIPRRHHIILMHHLHVIAVNLSHIHLLHTPHLLPDLHPRPLLLRTEQVINRVLFNPQNVVQHLVLVHMIMGVVVDPVPVGAGDRARAVGPVVGYCPVRALRVDDGRVG